MSDGIQNIVNAMGDGEFEALGNERLVAKIRTQLQEWANENNKTFSAAKSVLLLQRFDRLVAELRHWKTL